MIRSKKMGKARLLLIGLSFLLFPITMNWMSPYLPIAGLAEGLITGSLVFYLILFVTGIFFGRIFCGWLCPMGALQDGCATVRETPLKGRWVSWIKWLVFIPWFGAIMGLLLKSGEVSLEILYLFENGVSVDSLPGLIRYFFVIGLVILLALLGRKRLLCHSACWIAPFMILGKKLGQFITLPQLKLTSDKSSCTSCDLCTKSCPMSLPVRDLVSTEKIDHHECILCGNCTEVYHKDCISYTFSR